MGGSHTTLGEGALDFCVRNGNRYDSPSMATGKSRKSLGIKENRDATEDAGVLSSSEVMFFEIEIS